MGEDSLVGSIGQFAGFYAPVNWLECNGQEIEIHRYPPLYALLGTMYGGDGVKTFKLPNMPVESGMPKFYICVNGVFPTRWN